MPAFEEINLENSVNKAQEWLDKMALETKPKEISAMSVVKEALKTSDDIEETASGFVVWDKYGMPIGYPETLEEAVDILFIQYYTI